MNQKKDGSVFQSGREITVKEISEIQETVCSFPNLPLSELTATICEHLEWFTPSGGYKLDACMKLLEKLEEDGLIQLPAKREEYQRNRAQKPIPLTNRTDSTGDINCALRQLGPVRVEAVNDRKKTALWNEYVSRYHYLGYKKPFGYFLRYFVVSECGFLGCLMFAGPAKAIRVRDEWIGWTETQRLRNLAWVINNSRFLIFPWVHVKNLASHILGQAARRVKDDWLKRWGYSPILLETFVDPKYYHGSCYKAANWQYLGMTTGEGLVRKGKSYKTTPKMIFVMPLKKDFRALLCSDELKGRVVE
ncbi:MAG: DUF4338 domain-containing protein [Deltaproteobacteria bacterium]|nr:DUF4338 domain-containing protein [Deltaproteobacteria bacterium]MCD6266524.1 DUF4338 domain-containing protein [Deltaproteobacteria bacterium]RLB22440.1 MAG: hypothetical protein DRG73_06905 [Deltaproteobacteria bacterium]